MEQALFESESLFLELQKELDELKQASTLSSTRRSLYSTLESSSSSGVLGGHLSNDSSSLPMSSNKATLPYPSAKPFPVSSSSSAEPIDSFEAEARALEMRIRALRDNSSRTTPSLYSSERPSLSSNENDSETFLKTSRSAASASSTYKAQRPSPVSAFPPLSSSKPSKSQQPSHLTFAQAFSEAKAKLMSASESVRQDSFRNASSSSATAAAAMDVSGGGGDYTVSNVTSPFANGSAQEEGGAIKDDKNLVGGNRSSGQGLATSQSNNNNAIMSSLSPSSSSSTVKAIAPSFGQHQPSPTLSSTPNNQPSTATTASVAVSSDSSSNLKPKRDKIFSLLSPSSSSSSAAPTSSSSSTTKDTLSSSLSHDERSSPVVERTRELFAVAAARSEEPRGRNKSEAHQSIQPPPRFIRPSPSIMSSSLSASASINFGRIITDTRRLHAHLNKPTASEKWASEQASVQREEQERIEEEKRLKEEAEKQELEQKEQLEREVFVSQQKKEEEEQYLREWRRAEDNRIAQIHESEETLVLIAHSRERLKNMLEAIAATHTRPPRGKILFRMVARSVIRTAKRLREEKHELKNKAMDDNSAAIAAANKAAAAAAAEERTAYFNSPAFKKLPPHVRTQLLKEQRALSQPQPLNYHNAKIGNLLTTLMAKKGTS